ncbi:LIC11755 family lipoprotein [Leptospira sarikeiensis]|uniref:Lamin tail domain-containing protein n=1 Tax=Leptospira sarikeiensis TaxID=2484943 RepID=A0A4R9K330_9LEPT|nr:hypothetical protein [Leptospira sarikeiensis]TGL59556.1 hypothetical protein EHQ64_15815 [Leptospira sarikeiensis]
MKLSIPAICLFLYSILHYNCKQDAPTDLFLWEKKKSVRFQYEPDFAKRTELISVLLAKDDDPCLISGEDLNYKIEICVEEEGLAQIERTLSAWKNAELASEFDSNLSDGSKYKLGVFSLPSIKQKTKNIRFVLAGEESFQTSGKEDLIWTRKEYNLKNHIKTFSLFALSDTSFFLVIPSPNHEFYLGFSFFSDGLEEKIKNEILKKNKAGLEKCMPVIPEISEVFGETNSPIGRWIEIYNPHPFPICESGLEFNILGNSVKLPGTTGFISPKETRVYGEESSKLEKIYIPGIKWGDLKKVGSILLQKEADHFDLTLPGGGYLFGERYISWKSDGFSSCNIPVSLCMDPGIQNKVGLDAEDICDPENFVLEELNASGLRFQENFQKDWKYLEILYIGTKICNLSGLRVLWGNESYPFPSKKIRPNDLLSIGNLPILLGESSFFLKNFGSVHPIDPVKISGFGKEKKLWDGVFRTARGIPTRVISEKTNGQNVSFCFENGNVSIHPYSKEPTKKQIDLENPRTSISRKSCEINGSSQSVRFSEVSWMGSYKGTEAISKDRFLEFVSEGSDPPSSAFLEIIQSNGAVVSILVPIEKEGLTLLSSGNSVCFPETEFWKDTNFSLPITGITTLRIYDPNSGELWDEFQYSSSGPGVNDTRNKIRKSAYSKINSGVRSWETSQYLGKPFRDPSCTLTEAHPGFTE